MDNKPDDKRPPEPPRYVVKPPIYSLVELLGKQPALLGALLGALAGLLGARYVGLQTGLAVISGAVVGLVIAVAIERLRSSRS